MGRRRRDQRRNGLRIMVLLTVVALLSTSCSLWRWGFPDSTPTVVAGAGDDWFRASAGNNYDCAINLDRTLWCWGSNEFGQLGIGSTTRQSAPTQVGSDADWNRVSAGDAHTCATKQDGTLWCWGSNLGGAIGDGASVDRLVPTQVGTSTDWRDVSVAGYRVELAFIGFDDDLSYTCAIKTGGTLWCWGDNRVGQLGEGTTSQRTPTQVGTGSDWNQVSAGPTHACGIRSTDQLYCWGNNDYGQLGAALGGPGPRQVTGSWRFVSAGGYIALQPEAPPEARGHTCAVASSPRTLSCWGDNQSGQLGDGTTVARSVPVAVGTATDWLEVSAGGFHTCGLRSASTLWCWGRNASGQIGDGTDIDRLTPVQIGATTPWLVVDAGVFHTLSVDRIEPA